MLNRTIAGFAVALAAVLLASSSSPAQPGQGGDPVKKLETELEKLRDQVKEAEAKLAKAKESSPRKGGFEGKGPFGKGGFGKGGFGKDFGKGKGGPPFGKGGFGPKGFDGKKKEEPKKDDVKKELAKAFGSKLDPATVKEKYEFYKKLYEELPKDTAKAKTTIDFRKGKGPFTKGTEASSVEARLDRLVKELEDLRKELKKR